MFSECVIWQSANNLRFAVATATSAAIQFNTIFERCQIITATEFVSEMCATKLFPINLLSIWICVFTKLLIFLFRFLSFLLLLLRSQLTILVAHQNGERNKKPNYLGIQNDKTYFNLCLSTQNTIRFYITMAYANGRLCVSLRHIRARHLITCYSTLTFLPYPNPNDKSCKIFRSSIKLNAKRHNISKFS